MKTITGIVTLSIVLALSGMCLYQQRLIKNSRSELASARTRLADVEMQLLEKAEQAEKTEFAERKASLLQKTLTDVSELADEKARHAAVLQESIDTANTNSPVQSFAKIFKDPEMKKMMQSQQKAVIGPMLEKQYSQLIQQLNLTPEQATQFKDLLEKKMLAAAEMGVSLVGGNVSAAERDEMTKQMKEQNDAYEEEIKQLLGGDNYTSYKDYEKTLGDRMAISQFRDQYANTGMALNSGQEEQLLKAMQEERNNFKWTADFNQAKNETGNIAAFLTEEHVNKFIEETERLHQQITTRAAQILSPEQLAAFDKNLSAQRNMQAASMKMAAKMFGAQK
jgi:hypothetical protein